MGVTKQYLRYVPHSMFNVIGSPRGGLASLGRDLAAVAAVSRVDVWNLRRGEKVASLQHTATSKKLEVSGRCVWCVTRGLQIMARN